MVMAQAASSGPLIWCGLDYSKVKMIGTTDFRQPEQIFPRALAEWNGLFMKEMLPNLEKMAKDVGTDLEAINELNEKTSSKQVEVKDGTKAETVDQSEITAADIEKQVAGYKLTKKEGVGLVYIMDRLVKTHEMGCMHVVFFDVASRKVLQSERLCEKAGGIGFRNYWFRPIKTVTEKKLPKMYKSLATR
jgi:hypothetical protein